LVVRRANTDDGNVRVHDVDVLRRVDRLVAEAALVGGEDVAASHASVVVWRRQLAQTALSREGRVVADGCGHEAHFREAHGTGEGQAGVTQRFAGHCSSNLRTVTASFVAKL